MSASSVVTLTSVTHTPSGRTNSISSLSSKEPQNVSSTVTSRESCSSSDVRPVFATLTPDQISGTSSSSSTSITRPSPTTVATSQEAFSHSVADTVTVATSPTFAVVASIFRPTISILDWLPTTWTYAVSPSTATTSNLPVAYRPSHTSASNKTVLHFYKKQKLAVFSASRGS